MKRIMCYLLALILTFGGITPSYAADSGIRVLLDGSEISFDVPPMVIDGRTMVPLRAIFEALGAVVLWDDATKTVLAHKGTESVQATVGQTEMIVGGEIKEMDIAPMIINGRTVVPARFVAEAFECEVLWNGENKIVYINSHKNIQENSTGNIASIALNYEYYYLKPSQTVQLLCTTEPFVNNPHVVWESSSGYVSVEDGLVSVVADGFGMVEITATADNGMKAVCRIMAEAEQSAIKKVDNEYVYIKYPDILSIENAIPDARLWHEADISMPEFGIYSYYYTYLFHSLERAEKCARDYAYYLKEKGYSLIREEDDPIIAQNVGTDIIYELKSPDGQYMISVKGSPAAVGTPYVTPTIDVSIEPVSIVQNVTKASPVIIKNMCGKMDSVGGVQWSFDLENKSEKTIKYVTISWQCYNKVMDPIADIITNDTIVTLRVTGPIYSGTTESSIKNSTRFYNGSYANYIRLNTIKIEYMDGSEDILDVDYLENYWYQDYSVTPFEMALKGYVMLVNILEQ